MASLVSSCRTLSSLRRSTPPLTSAGREYCSGRARSPHAGRLQRTGSIAVAWLGRLGSTYKYASMCMQWHVHIHVCEHVHLGPPRLNGSRTQPLVQPSKSQMAAKVAKQQTGAEKALPAKSDSMLSSTLSKLCAIKSASETPCKAAMSLPERSLRHALMR